MLELRYHVYQFLDKTDNFEFSGPNLPKNGFCSQNFKDLNLDLESVSLRYYEYQFSDKTENFEFLDPNLPKNEFWGQNFKNLSLDSEPASLRYYVYQFSDKMDNFEFLGPNLPKNGFWGSEFQTFKSGFGINTSNIPCVPIFIQNGQLLIFWPNFGKIAQLRAIFLFKYC